MTAKLRLTLLAALLCVPTVGAFAQTAPAPVSTSTESGQRTEPAATQPEKEAVDENDAYKKSPAVIAIGRKLGLSPDQAALTFEIGNFVILAVAVLWFLARLLPKTFRNRNTVIQKSLVDARTATEEATARLNAVEARLSKLDAEIAAMQTQAEADSAAEERRIKASVEEEKQKIITAAEQEISAATAQAHRSLQHYAAELAIEQAARKLSVSAETDRLLVQNFAARLTESDRGGEN